jgi:hypothetical protein
LTKKYNVNPVEDQPQQQKQENQHRVILKVNSHLKI